MLFSVNSHSNATRIGWHLWEIDLRFAPELPPGWNIVIMSSCHRVMSRSLMDESIQTQIHFTKLLSSFSVLQIENLRNVTPQS